MLYDITDKTTCPAFAHGRWYHFLIESNADGYKLTLADLESAELSGNNLYLPAGFHIVDFKIELEANPSSTLSLHHDLKVRTDGTQGITLPSSSNCDWIELWIFAHNT